MAINKAQTSVGMKVVLIILIVAFVVSFISISTAGLFMKSDQQSTKTDPIATINQKYQPQVTAFEGLLKSEPTSYTVLVQAGNANFDWALELDQSSQNNTAAATAAATRWIAAKDAYEKALKVKPGDPNVTTDYSFVAFRSGDSSVAVAAARQVVEKDPTFAPAWFNLGVFYQNLSQPILAAKAYETYLKLDPKGEKGNAQYAKDQLKTLKAGGTTTP